MIQWFGIWDESGVQAMIDSTTSLGLQSESYDSLAVTVGGWRKADAAACHPLCGEDCLLLLHRTLRHCLAQLIFSFFTNLSRSFTKQTASAAAYQFSCFSK
jgi:hypothetical protein